VRPFTGISEQPDQPERASAHIGSAIWPRRLPFEKPLAVAKARLPIQDELTFALLASKLLYEQAHFFWGWAIKKVDHLNENWSTLILSM